MADTRQHPVHFAVDYPDRPLNRVTTALRPFTAIPVAIVLASVSGGSFGWAQGSSRTTIAFAGGVLFIGPLLACSTTWSASGAGTCVWSDMRSSW